MSLPASNPLFSSQVLLEQLRKYLPLILVIGLHVALFYGLRSGLVHQVAQSVSREIFAKFVTLDPEPAPPKEVPLVPKPVVKKKPKPKPVIIPEPSPQAITEEAPPEEESPPEEVSNEPVMEVESEPAPAPAAAAPAAPKIISGVAYINQPRPVYPPLDARMGKEGTVKLRVLINEKGKAERVEIEESSGSLRMDDAARTAVMRALFKPYVENGRPMPAMAIIPINFTLKK